MVHDDDLFESLALIVHFLVREHKPQSTMLDAVLLLRSRQAGEANNPWLS
jgi:hypothetical protein